MTANAVPTPFYCKDCALSAIAIGEKAQNLQELYNKLSSVHPGSVYYHFWGGRLRPHYEIREYHNDYAMWAYHSLRDQTLAERLAVIDPIEFDDLELLRGEVLSTIETRLDEIEQIPWTPKVPYFHFVRSTIVVFDTNYCIAHPRDLVQILPKLASEEPF